MLQGCAQLEFALLLTRLAALLADDVPSYGRLLHVIASILLNDIGSITAPISTVDVTLDAHIETEALFGQLEVDHMPLNIKRGSIEPVLTITIVDQYNRPYPITNMESAEFVFYDENFNQLFRKPAEILNDTHLRYAWDVGDTDRDPGIYYGEFVVTLSTGAIVRIPSDKYLEVRIW